MWAHSHQLQSSHLQIQCCWLLLRSHQRGFGQADWRQTAVTAVISSSRACHYSAYQLRRDVVHCIPIPWYLKQLSMVTDYILLPIHPNSIQILLQVSTQLRFWMMNNNGFSAEERSMNYFRRGSPKGFLLQVLHSTKEDLCVKFRILTLMLLNWAISPSEYFIFHFPQVNISTFTFILHTGNFLEHSLWISDTFVTFFGSESVYNM